MATDGGSDPAPDGSIGLVPGQLLAGRFQVLGAASPSSLGVVYPGRDRATRTAVAIEALPHRRFLHPRQVDSLRRAVRRFAKLDHPGLRAVYAMGLTEGGAPYVVLEPLDGLTLAAILAARDRPRRPLSLRGVYDVTALLASALEAAHPSRVHAAVRPQAVHVSRQGRVKLGDLGTAYATLRVTGVEAFPAEERRFLAPELREGERPTIATDVYGLGAVTYAMLTGTAPAEDGYDAVGRRRPDVAEALDELLSACLNRAPGARPGSPERVRRALMSLVKDAPEVPARDDFGVDLVVDLEPIAALPTVPVRVPPVPVDPPARIPGVAGEEISLLTLSPPAPLVPIDREPDESTDILLEDDGDAVAAPPAQDGGPHDDAPRPRRPPTPRPEDAAPRTPLPEPPLTTDVDLNAALQRIRTGDAHRWMVVKDGLDHGPFSGRELLDLIAKGDVRGAHGLLDTDTGRRQKVQDHDDFRLFTAQYDLKHAARKEREKLDIAEKRRRTLGLAQILAAGAILLVIVGSGVAFLASRNAAQKTRRTDDERASLYEAGDIEIVGSAGILPEPKRRRGGSGGRRRTGGGGGSAGGGFGSYDDAMNRAVELGDVTKGGGEARLSSSTVAGVMNRNINRLYGCVGQELRRGGSLSKVTIDLAIAGNGRVLGATVRPGSGAFQGCITSKVRGIRFPTFSAPRMGARYSFQVD